MNSTTLDSLRINFLRIISTINLVTSTLIIIGFTIAGRDLVPIHPFLIVVSSITLITLKKFPKSTNIAKFYAIAITLFSSVANYRLAMQGSTILTYPYFLAPLFASFLLGSTGGFILSALYIILPLLLCGFDISIFGDNANAFIAVYVIEIIVILCFERVHDYLHNQILKASYTDPLTGLQNTSGFMFNLTKATQKKEGFYLILTDFDYFSRINTNLGYSICDTILKRAGEMLSDHKAVSHVARYYGDQFAIVFHGSKEEVSQFIEMKQREIRTISREMNLDIDITISSGIIHFPGDCKSVEMLMGNVELALKEAKKADREMYHFFDSDSLNEQRFNDCIRKTIHSAVINEEIKVHFQPKVNVKDSVVTGMEALIRWDHPELGYLAPPVYIEIAESSGLISEVSEYVIEKSCAHLARCKVEGFDTISLSINISPIHLLKSDFLEKLLATTNKYSLDSSQIFLEITENLLLEGDVKVHLEKIRAAGFKLSLDDFGTGYSSLNYLRQFRFDELKIDKCFTDGLLNSTSEVKMFETILSIASIYKMSIVIEGVEEQQQVSMIREHGVGEIQGWYYSKALPSDLFISYLQKSLS